MFDVMMILGLTLMAGMAMPFGALIGSKEHIHPDWLENEFRHSVIAFGGGALLSAVALVLVPEGTVPLDLMTAALCFCGGGLIFMALDMLLYKLNTPASQLAAMLSDFIPESLALGATLVLGGVGNALLLAGLMVLQNMPEGFNAYRELGQSKRYSGRKIIALFTMMALLGPIAGLSGYIWLADSPSLVAGIMMFAAGGILYSVFQDIAPQAVLEKHWAPPMGAVLGFVLGIVGHMLTTHG
ncbi:ZIP family metal transporter [Oceanisphaera sp. KMM 10153]|uniref:ZIP family metal transporter n=1 Tax=Oceanisphaera submarina TaxID=3390193 RepID=UPI00397608F8